jgi:hypothetical protein
MNKCDTNHLLPDQISLLWYPTDFPVPSVWEKVPTTYVIVQGSCATDLLHPFTWGLLRLPLTAVVTSGPLLLLPPTLPPSAPPSHGFDSVGCRVAAPPPVVEPTAPPLDNLQP